MKTKTPRYKVHWQGTGYGKPTLENPNGIKIKAEGIVIVNGERPKSSMDIPNEIVNNLRNIFFEQTGAIRMEGDNPPHSYRGCTFWLGKSVESK